MEPGNKLHIESLGTDWRDKDSVMLHACFQLLKDCVEKESLLTGHIDWSHDDRYSAAKKELESLYEWWIGYRELDIPEMTSYEKENEMLHRLIEIRWTMWT